MIRFECDYAEGCHPSILAALSASNEEQTPGYGLDPHCERARAMIRNACAAPDADIHFLVGGTQANTTVIAAALRPYQGALCSAPGHINVPRDRRHRVHRPQGPPPALRRREDHRRADRHRP